MTPTALTEPAPSERQTKAATVVAAYPVGTRASRLNALDATSPEHPDLFADPDGGALPAGPIKTPPAHPKIYDASENTALDPLRNKTYDLNTAKTIPADLVH